MLIPVILSGGSGTRLWPLSRELYPKQLLPLVGEHTMLQETARRVEGMADVAAPIVVCNESHRFMVAEQLHALGTAPSAIILEPVGRNTAPAVAVAALVALTPTLSRSGRGGGAGRGGEDPVLLVLPADHVIRDVEEFRKVVQAGLRGGAGGQARDVRRGAGPARDGLRLHPSCEGRGAGVSGRGVRREARPRHGRALRAVGRVLLEQRHVHVPRADLPRRAAAARAGDAVGLRGRGRRRETRPRFHAPARPMPSVPARAIPSTMR